MVAMAIGGGVAVPKLMGNAVDHFGLSRTFIVPLACLAAAAPAYGYLWPRFSDHETMHAVTTHRGY